MSNIKNIFTDYSIGFRSETNKVIDLIDLYRK